MARTQTTDSADSTAAKKPDTAATSEKVAPAAKAQMAAPIVLEKRKKRKKRYSRRTEDLQRAERGLTKASYRVANAVAVGMNTLTRKGDKSARRRRDGAMRDGLRNAAMALGDGGSELSKAPYDFARRVRTNVVWKQARAALRVIAPPGMR